ncbi:helix-turn-helix protein [Mucilaginibacter yixingensis]|uniref:Helix-turn-helix protein n=1 Tax=Mucilaginibacter yixingensis TaxID=1295612 RepID=A0A2T5J8X1_9SPHI|nr:helix-turn-helix transcriptional regulator [Mucilaginibacter yixingensis]PTQ96522.1 helix-turn-helix protein [Mucilaginibacter yixingensis]
MPLNSFGHFIKACRITAGLSQTILASHLGIARAHLSRIECGKKKLRIEKLETLSHALDINLTDLKKEFYSDIFAEEILKNDCPITVLEATKQKITRSYRIKNGYAI